MLIAGVAPPLLTTGAVPVTLVTVPTEIEPPRLVLVPLIVMAEFTRAELGIEVRLAPDPLNVVAVIVVPVMASGVVPPITGGLDKSKVPPKVRLPVLVTVPLNVIPETVPVPLTEVTPVAAAFAQDGTPDARVKT